ncbi:hypothetical protein EVG20_g6264 [Dentipellis fragilis]|uniref:Uncharacterized protein n=1 Tax=Dentipellis fragilis TaxID=205917 RepID=A0A4Y9YLX0_9AGAM|nr:hypothetical protein EVG20_g6264 [Dentipellis fragilis]
MNRFPVCPFSAEFEVDSEGKRIPDPEFGYKLTAQSLENRDRWRAASLKGREPLPTLPSHLRVSPLWPANTLPSLLFGFPLRMHHVFDYAKRRQVKLLDKTRAEPVYRSIHAIMKVIADLDRRCGADLHYGIPRIDGYDFMISLYTNLTLSKDQLEAVEERDVIDILMRELQLSEPPMWYWDASFIENS